MGDATILRLGLEAAQRAARGEPFEAELTEGVWRVLDADAGVGLTTWGHGADGVDRVTVEVAGAPALSDSYLVAARAVVPSHPSFACGMREHPTHRVSDLVPIEAFWDTEAFSVMHGFCDGRYPAAVTLLNAPTATVFLGLHRSRRDFTDLEMSRLNLLREPLGKALEYRLALDSAAERLRTELPRTQTFTAKEAQVLVLVAHGWTDTRIARHLGISEPAVRKRLSAARDRVGAVSRAHAAAWWTRLNP